MKSSLFLLKTILILNVFLTTNCLGQSYGLVFLSHDLIAEKRTSLDLFPNKPYKPNGNFQLSFELSLLPDQRDYFGYVFRIVEDGKKNIDLVFSSSTPHDRLKTYNFKLIDNDNPKIAINVSKPKLYNRWHTVNLTFDYEHDRLVLQMNDMEYIENNAQLNKRGKYKFVFGVNSETSDSPPMKIRNVKIESNHKVNYSWPLNDVNGNIADEMINHQYAKVINPLWSRSQHRKWDLRKNFKINGLASVAFNEKDGVLYIIGSDSLWNYSFTDSKLTAVAYKSGSFNLLPTNQSIYDPTTGKLYNYYIDQLHHQVSSFDFRTNKWNYETKVYSDPRPSVDNWHTNSFFSAIDTSLYIACGYGHHVFKNDIKTYNTVNKSLKDISLKGDFLYPRYLASAGITDSGRTAYLLGGYGSKTGQQIMNPKYLYDLIKFDIKNKSFKKIYDLNVKGENFVFGNSMVIDQQSKTFKTLVFPNNRYYSQLRLMTGYLDKPVYQLAADFIPFEFHDISSFSNLYFSQKTQQLIAVTILRQPATKKSEVKIYTLLNPPDLSIEPAYGLSSSSHSFIFWIVLFVGIAITLFIVFYILKLNKHTIPILSKKTEQAQTKLQPNFSVDNNYSEVMHNIKENAIYLFGDLKLITSNGTDLVKDFTSLLQELFLIILLDSVTSGRGISNERLIDILWPDKSEDSAKNNRAANLSRLKSILTQMGSVELSRSTGQWKIHVDTSLVYFDYYHYLQIINDRKHITKEKIDQLIEITQRGNFLANFYYPWLDQIKSEITNQNVDIFLEYANTLKCEEHPEFLIKLADSLFHLDPVNEEAMIIKCKCLAHLGKHSLSKQTFENFIKEFKALYGEEFKRDFHSVLGGV